MTYLYILEDGAPRQVESGPEGELPETDLAAVRYGELSIYLFDDGDFYAYGEVGGGEWGWERVDEG